MKSPWKAARAAFPFAPVLVASFLLVQLAWSSDDLEEYLKSNYADKVLTLRHFYKGERLSFQSDGSLVGSAEEGPWTVDGQIQVRQIKRHGSSLQIQGRRVCLVFDGRGKPFRDVLSFLAESKLKDRDKLENFFRANSVAVEIALASDRPDLSVVSTAMNAVFLSSAESIRDVVPEYWRDYFDQINGRPPGSASAPMYNIKSGITAPRVVNQSEPEFSEEARLAKYQGTMTVSLVVDPYGSVRDIQILSPLGLGLDEKAVAAVSAWKFNPAMKDDQPVPVKIAVDVSFRLY
jgi:TonB family protein